MLSKNFTKLNLKIETRHTIMQSFYFSVYLASVNKEENQIVVVEKNFLIESKNWTGCVVRQKMRSIFKTNHTQDRTMRTKGIFSEMWIGNMVLKDSGYNKEESYLLTGQYFLLSALLAKKASLVINEQQKLINFWKGNRKQKKCRLKPWSRIHKCKLWRKK